MYLTQRNATSTLAPNKSETDSTPLGEGMKTTYVENFSSAPCVPGKQEDL